MLTNITSIPRQAMRFLRNDPGKGIRSIVKKLERALAEDSKRSVNKIPDFIGSYLITEAFHLAVDNLTDVYAAIMQFSTPRREITVNDSIDFLDGQISKCEALLLSDLISHSSQASEIVGRTLNLLFFAKQQIKRRYSLVLPKPPSSDMKSLDRAQTSSPPRTEKALEANLVPHLTLHSSLLYQLYHSLFPAERMMVAAGRQEGDEIIISALFDVTGTASATGVHADPDRLGRALISMSETDTYLVAWLHSHPGSSSDATYPSPIDLRQERNWLRDYSPLLVSAIMVRDGFVRFWGKALENGKVAVRIEGPGIRACSNTENVYQLLA